MRCVNQIEDVCKDIEKTINQTIQNTLNQLERDCDEIKEKVDNAILMDNKARHHNLTSSGKGFLMLMAGLILPLSTVLSIFASSFSDKTIRQYIGDQGLQYLHVYLVSPTLFTNLETVFYLIALGITA